MEHKEADKKVELSELFYDLVFVYAVSKSTELIHHLQGGVLRPFVFFTFAVAFVILVNTWMYQTMFTNRYGANGILDNLTLFIQMGLVLILANSMTTDWGSSFVPFTVSAGLLSVILALQYVIIYIKTQDKNDKQVSKVFLSILGIRSAIILSSLLFPHDIGVVISLLGILVGLVAPMFFVSKMKERPVNFPHLTERLSLLAIITFGEMIVGVATYFEWASLSGASVFVLLTVIMMFLLYVMQFDRVVDRHKENVTGVAMVYLHYPIYFGIILTNVAFSYLLDPDINRAFSVWFLFGGILLFTIGVSLGDLYQKQKTSITTKAGVWLALIVLALIASLVLPVGTDVVIIITGIVTTANLVYMLLIEKRRRSAVNLYIVK